jgi:endonuclease/exonuclease/phosphatase (EEP) superfamily protein YafD
MVTKRTRKRRWARRRQAAGGWVFGAAAVFVSSAVALSVLAGVLSGGAHPWVIATYLRWPQLVASAVATAVLFSRRWLRTASAAAVVTAALVVSIALPLLQLRTADAPRVGDTLRIAVFNTGPRNDEIAAIADAIRAAQPDVAVLLESEDVADQVDARLDGLSRLRTEDGPVAASAPIVLARHAWPLQMAPLADGRPATIVTADIAGSAVDIVAVHTLPPLLRAWAATHDRQMAALADDVLPRPGPYVVAGDLNSTPWSPSMRRLLATGLRGSTVLPTFGVQVVGIPLDHVLLSPKVVAIAREMGPFAGSDHRLIMTEVALRS